MKKSIILSLLATLMFAQNISVYSALGNVIYENAKNIEKLQYLSEFSSQKEEIEKYIKEVNATKKDGFLIELEDKNIDKDRYLKKLKELSVTNDYFMKIIKDSFKESIQNENSRLFSDIVNSGLIDADRYKEEIETYYLQHSDEVNRSGVIGDFLDKNAILKIESEINLITKDMQEKRIKQIIQEDETQQESIKKSLEDEVAKKKQ